jgi:hypothetical protein
MEFKVGDVISIRPISIDDHHQNWIGVIATVIGIVGDSYVLNYYYDERERTADFSKQFIDANFIICNEAFRVLYGI